MNVYLPELISAYLDGEATAEECVIVEKTLVEDAALRRTYYQLKALRERLSKLPRYRLAADLSREVLRQAERAMLRGSSGGAPETSSGALSMTKNRTTSPRTGRERYWIFSACLGSVVAASIAMIVILQSFQEVSPQMAQVSPPAERTEKAVDKRAELMAQRNLTAPVAPAPVAPAFNPPVSVAASRSAPMTPAPVVASGVSEQAAPRIADASKNPARSGAIPAAESNLAETPATTKVTGAMNSGGPMVGPGDVAAGKKGFARESLQDVQTKLAVTNGTLTIYCDVRGTEYEALLKHSLQDNNIAWQDLQTKDDASGPRESANSKSLQAGSRGTTSDGALPEAGMTAESQEDDKQAVRSPLVADGQLRDALAATAELVEVQASAEQITGVLEDLYSHRQVFQSTTIHPIPGATEQESLARWNWSEQQDSQKSGQSVGSDLHRVEEKSQQILRKSPPPKVTPGSTVVGQGSQRSYSADKEVRSQPADEAVQNAPAKAGEKSRVTPSNPTANAAASSGFARRLRMTDSTASGGQNNSQEKDVREPQPKPAKSDASTTAQAFGAATQTKDGLADRQDQTASSVGPLAQPVRVVFVFRILPETSAPPAADAPQAAPNADSSRGK